MWAAGGGYESEVTTLITRRLGLWGPVWKGLSRGSRERDGQTQGPCPTRWNVTEAFVERGVTLPRGHSGADLNAASQSGLQLSVWVGGLACFGDVRTRQLAEVSWEGRGQCLTGPF